MVVLITLLLAQTSDSGVPFTRAPLVPQYKNKKQYHLVHDSFYVALPQCPDDEGGTETPTNTWRMVESDDYGITFDCSHLVEDAEESK